MENGIFCLETEWEQTVRDLKFESQAKPLLDFLQNSNDIDYVFRQVATPVDFDYYIKHLEKASYNPYKIVYLSFHGSKHSIVFADKTECDLNDFATKNPGIFEDKIVHFGSCSTLKMKEDDIMEFKANTCASLVTGYQRSVEMTGSFIFEAWLLNTLHEHPTFTAKQLMNKANKEMAYFVEKYKFVAY